MSEAQDEKPFVFMYLEPDESRNFSYDEDEDGNEVKEYPQGSQPNWRSKITRLGKKAAENMRQLIGADDGKVAPMNWDNFLKVRYSVPSVLYCAHQAYLR